MHLTQNTRTHTFTPHIKSLAYQMRVWVLRFARRTHTYTHAHFSSQVLVEYCCCCYWIHVSQYIFFSFQFMRHLEIILFGEAKTKHFGRHKWRSFLFKQFYIWSTIHYEKRFALFFILNTNHLCTLSNIYVYTKCDFDWLFIVLCELFTFRDKELCVGRSKDEGHKVFFDLINLFGWFKARGVE